MAYYYEKVHFVLLYGAIIYFGFFAYDTEHSDALDAKSNVNISLFLATQYLPRHCRSHRCDCIPGYAPAVCWLNVQAILESMESCCCDLFLLPLFLGFLTLPSKHFATNLES